MSWDRVPVKSSISQDGKRWENLNGFYCTWKLKMCQHFLVLKWKGAEGICISIWFTWLCINLFIYIYRLFSNYANNSGAVYIYLSILYISYLLYISIHKCIYINPLWILLMQKAFWHIFTQDRTLQSISLWERLNKNCPYYLSTTY